MLSTVTSRERAAFGGLAELRHRDRPMDRGPLPLPDDLHAAGRRAQLEVAVRRGEAADDVRLAPDVSPGSVASGTLTKIPPVAVLDGDRRVAQDHAGAGGDRAATWTTAPIGCARAAAIEVSARVGVASASRRALASALAWDRRRDRCWRRSVSGWALEQGGRWRRNSSWASAWESQWRGCRSRCRVGAGAMSVTSAIERRISR